MVNPPWTRLAIGLPEGATSLIPSIDFQVGFYNDFLGGYMHVFLSTISALENP